MSRQKQNISAPGTDISAFITTYLALSSNMIHQASNMFSGRYTAAASDSESNHIPFLEAMPSFHQSRMTTAPVKPTLFVTRCG